MTLITLQVKTTTYKREGNLIVALKSGGKGKGNRNVAKDFDLLYVIDADDNEYIIDYNKISNRTTQNNGRVNMTTLIE